jgi:hypothetical protein
MRHAKPKNVHPLLPKKYTMTEEDDSGQTVKRNIYYVPLPLNLGLVKYPFAWTKIKGGCYGLTGISIRTRYWALFDFADYSNLDERGEYLLQNIRQRRNNSVRVK